MQSEPERRVTRCQMPGSLSDSETGRRGFPFRRPGVFRTCRTRGGDASSVCTAGDESGELSTIESGDLTELSSLRQLQQGGEQSVGEEAGSAAQGTKENIYKISGENGGSTEGEIDPLSNDYMGILTNYFSIGLMCGGSTSLLYPILIVRDGATSSLMTASHAVVNLFWSYKIVFGFLSDCFPIAGYKRKPYIILGWLCCSIVLAKLVREGDNVESRHLVIMLAMANMGYVMADVAADGFMVWIAHREPIHKRGRMQSSVYSTISLGQVVINVVILLGFSGPNMNCAGYEPDPASTCTLKPSVLKRADPALLEAYPEHWCHEKCPLATFDWDITIPEFALCICFVIAGSMPLYLRLKEDKVRAEPRWEFLKVFWSQLQRRAAWQVILYGMISQITLGVMNAAKMPANFVWLDLSTFQYQIMVIFEKVIFFVGLNLIRKIGLNMSWRKMVLAGSCLVTMFNILYYLIIFDVYRNAWFYVFTDVSIMFMYTLNFVATHFCMVEVAEPGYEAITYSLITTATNSVTPLSAVISYQLLAFFPKLNEQASIATDTPEVRWEFASLQTMVILINLSSLLALPLLPRQKRETRELVAGGERSAAWGLYVVISGLTFLGYSTVVTFVTVMKHDTYGCFKLLGGEGCSADESSLPALLMVSAILMFCYGTNFYASYLPILRGENSFSYRMFV